MTFAYTFYFSSFIASLINPFWGLVGLIVSVLIRFQDRYPEIVSIKPFSLLFLGMIIGCFLHRDKLAQHDWKQDKLLIYILIVSILGLLVMNRGEVIPQTWEYISSLAFYFFATRLLQERKHFIILFAVMSCSIVYMGYEAIEHVALFPETSHFLDERNGRWQGLGYYKNANEFGQLMSTTLPFLLAALIMKNNIVIKIVALGFISILVYVVTKSESRTVMVLIGVMIVLTIILRGRGNIIKKTIKGSVIGVVLLVGLSYAPGPIQDRLGSILDAGSDKSFQGRTRSWEHGFAMLSWYPITGVGKGEWIEYHGLMPHNSYVQVMAELGIAGIILFISILKLSFLEFKPFFIDPEDSPDKNNHSKDQPFYKANTDKENIDTEAITPVIEIPIETKTVVIAVATVYTCWLIYIFLGNQAYSIWTYFYIGLCGAIRNLLPQEMNMPSKEFNVFGERK